MTQCNSQKICKLCGEEKKLVESHIIPRSFFNLIKFEKEIPRIYPKNSNKYPQRSPTGFYDKELVCEYCERVFSPWDDYAKTLLLDEPHTKKYFYFEGKKIGYKIDFYEYDKLKQFFLSILWKSSVTKHTFFSEVCLGPFEKKIHHMIINNDPGDEDDFAIFIKKYENSMLSKVIHNPCKNKILGINFYKYFVTDYIFYIKVDHRITPKKIKNFVLTPDKPLFILVGDFYQSKEFKTMIKFVKESKH